eukprot:PITA_08398
MASLHSEWPLIWLQFLSLTTVTFAINVREMNIDEYLNYVNPPAVHKFKNEHGDSILCVLYADQISLRGSEQRPVETRDERKTKLAQNFSSFDVKKGCPLDTVPILETQRDDVERAGSVTGFLNRERKIKGHLFTNLTDGILDSDGDVTHTHAVVSFKPSGPVHQASAGLNVWKPNVDVDGSGIFSVAQIWVINESGEIETVETGWMVNPAFSDGDTRPRFFTYWTADGYRNTGCKNQECDGFVIAHGAPNYLGVPISPVSTYNGNQQQISLKILRENPGGNGVRWSLYIGNQLNGWWPGSLFKNLNSNAANRVDFGGEVAYIPGTPGSAWSKTEMGSGHFAREDYGRSAHVRDIKIANDKGAIVDAVVRPVASNPKCYDLSAISEQRLGKHFYFGGPGGKNNPACVY